MNSRQPPAQAKAPGCSGKGSHHWWLQRVTALALMPLTLWFLFAVTGRVGDDHASIVLWLSQPYTALPLILFLAFMFLHASLGLQVVIEDYVHGEAAKTALLLISKGVLLLAWVAATFSVLRIAL